MAKHAGAHLERRVACELKLGGESVRSQLACRFCQRVVVMALTVYLPTVFANTI